MTTSKFVFIADQELVKEIGFHKAAFYHELQRFFHEDEGLVHENKKWVNKTATEWAIQMGCSVQTIRKWIKEFTKRGWIEVKQLGGCHRVNFYYVIKVR